MIIKSYNNVFLENRLFFKEKREMLGTCLENVRTQVPLVHNITNYVTVNDVPDVCQVLHFLTAVLPISSVLEKVRLP